MDLLEKISLRRYALGSVCAMAFALYVAHGQLGDSLLLLSGVLASALNQWLMFSLLGRAFNQTGEKLAPSKSFPALALQALVKLFGLGIYFYLLVKLGQHLLLEGVFLYTFQLIILVWSIKKRDAFYKKGPSQ